MYQPSEDSYFFAEFLKKQKLNKKSVLDMGTGSGILAETCLHLGANVLAVDINKEVVKFTSNKGINALQSNLFSKVNGKFDIILFNAPYLPRDKDEPKDSQLETTGGKKGDEVSIKFLTQAAKHLNKGGKIFLLISSLTPIKRINKFKPRIVARKKLFFEELLILEFTNAK